MILEGLRSCTRRCRDICKDFTKTGKQTDKKAEVGPRRWSGPTRIVSEEDTSLRRTMEIDETLARNRLERHEWDLAIPPLERALKTSSRLVSADDTARLKDTLQTARAKSQNTALEKPPPGEITNSIGMRLVAIASGRFCYGEHTGGDTSHSGRVECSGSNATAPRAQRTT